VQEALKRSAGVARTGRIAGVESIARNLDVEDAAYARSMRGDSAQAATGEEMRITAGGDVTVTEGPPKPSSSILTRAAIAAALLGSGAGAGVVVERAIHALSPPEVEAPVDADTRYEAKIELK